MKIGSILTYLGNILNKNIYYTVKTINLSEGIMLEEFPNRYFAPEEFQIVKFGVNINRWLDEQLKGLQIHRQI